MANFDNRHGWEQENVFLTYTLLPTSDFPADQTSEIVDTQSAVAFSFKLASVRFNATKTVTINSVRFQHSDDNNPANFVDIDAVNLVGDVNEFTNQVVDWVIAEFNPYNASMSAFNTKRFVRMIVNYTTTVFSANPDPVLIGFIKNETQIGVA